MYQRKRIRLGKVVGEERQQVEDEKRWQGNERDSTGSTRQWEVGLGKFFDVGVKIPRVNRLRGGGDRGEKPFDREKKKLCKLWKDRTCRQDQWHTVISNRKLEKKRRGRRLKAGGGEGQC